MRKRNRYTPFSFKEIYIDPDTIPKSNLRWHDSEIPSLKILCSRIVPISFFGNDSHRERIKKIKKWISFFPIELLVPISQNHKHLLPFHIDEIKENINYDKKLNISNDTLKYNFWNTIANIDVVEHEMGEIPCVDSNNYAVRLVHSAEFFIIDCIAFNSPPNVLHLYFCNENIRFTSGNSFFVMSGIPNIKISSYNIPEEIHQVSHFKSFSIVNFRYIICNNSSNSIVIDLNAHGIIFTYYVTNLNIDSIVIFCETRSRNTCFCIFSIDGTLLSVHTISSIHVPSWLADYCTTLLCANNKFIFFPSQRTHIAAYSPLHSAIAFETNLNFSDHLILFLRCTPENHLFVFTKQPYVSQDSTFIHLYRVNGKFTFIHLYELCNFDIMNAHVTSTKITVQKTDKSWVSIEIS